MGTPHVTSKARPQHCRSAISRDGEQLELCLLNKLLDAAENTCGTHLSVG
jgi:hypothetical protein